MFWVVQAGALVSTLVLICVFRNQNQPIHVTGRTLVKDYVPTILLLGTVGLLIAASFIPSKPSITNGIICVGLFIIGLAREFSKSNDIRVVFEAQGEKDNFTLNLLCGLFIVICGITEAGAIEEISKVLVKISDNNVFTTYTLIVWVSVLLSAFIDNIPYAFYFLNSVLGL
jgi:Na+/H+ antiporter NhaD/arsenite permease-like protein